MNPQGSRALGGNLSLTNPDPGSDTIKIGSLLQPLLPLFDLAPNFLFSVSVLIVTLCILLCLERLIGKPFLVGFNEP